MSRTRVELEVELDDGSKHLVVVDQRDFAKWEVQPEADADGDRTITRMRYLAWSAMTRQQLTDSKWPEFNERLCVDVGVPDQDGEGEQEGLDPGQSTTGATTSSTSPGSAGSRSPARAASRRGTRAT